MRIDALLPDVRAALRIHGVDDAFDIAEVRQEAVCGIARPDADRRAHAGVRAERPADAAIGRIQRVDEAGVGADETPDPQRVRGKSWGTVVSCPKAWKRRLLTRLRGSTALCSTITLCM